MKNINYIMRYIWHTEKSYILFRIPQIILNALNPFIMVLFPKLIIDKLTQNKYTDETWLYILRIVLIMVALNFVVNVSLRILYTCITNSFNSFSGKHTVNIGKKIMQLEYKNIENPDILNLFERTKDPGYCENMYAALSDIFSNTLTCVGLIFVLSKINFFIVIVILVVVGINVKCNRKIQKYDYGWHKEAAPYRRTSTYLINLMQNFEYGKDIRVYNESEYIVNKYNKFNVVYLKKLKSITVKFLKLNLITSIINIFQQGGVYVYLAYEVFKKKITLGTFTMLLSSIEQLTQCLVEISNSVVNIGNSTRYIEEFIQVMSMEEEITGERNVSDKTSFQIEFKGVWFKYPRSDNYVLKNINIGFNSKEMISIVGTNGSGKTTFIKLLLRLYRPTKGSILIDGIDLNTLDYDSYISLISTVFQDYKVSAYSIRENIAFDDREHEERIIDVLKKMNFYDRVMELPKGLDTALSKEFDAKGVELSGGEQQKIVIARALYYQSKLLILDEPTAALDPLMEYDIYYNILRTIKDRGLVFISHRLSVTRFCNKVFVFNQGEIVQTGTHYSLMKENDGLYYEMYSKQSEFYKDKVGYNE